VRGMYSERTRGADSTASQLGKALLVWKRITSESPVIRPEPSISAVRLGGNC
jgi:hypothetical protein